MMVVLLSMYLYLCLYVFMQLLFHCCCRTWELLTMGSIVVIERGIGYDRTVSQYMHILIDISVQAHMHLYRYILESHSAILFRFVFNLICNCYITNYIYI